MATRLNIGCNLIYKPGYINIDEHSEAIADIVTPPFNLPFPDNSVDVIETYNFLEQLNHEKGLLSLEEWFRVLKNDGILIIETINVETLIYNFVKAEETPIKESFLRQIYESENNHYKHKSGYFLGQLTSLLNEVGFESIEERVPTIKSDRQSFKLMAKKPFNATLNMIVLRSKKQAFLELDSLSIEHPQTFWEFKYHVVDELLKKILSRISEIPLKKNRDFYKVITYSPKVAKIFLKECYNSNLIKKDDFDYIETILGTLITQNFVSASYKTYFDIPKNTTQKPNYYDNILESNIEFLSEALKTPIDIVEPLIEKHIKKTYSSSKSLNVDLSKDIFSFEYLKEQSEFLQAKAIKSFAKTDKENAYYLFIEALKLNPKLVLTYLNLGLLELQTKNYSKALELFYQASQITENDKILLQIALCLLYLNDFKEVVRIASNLQEDSYEKFALLGNAYFHLGKYSDSCEAFSWASILNNSPYDYVNLGIAQNKLNNKVDAQKNFIKAKNLIPNIQIQNVPTMPPLRTMPFSVGEV